MEILGEDVREAPGRSPWRYSMKDLKAEANEILLQAFARGEPWAVELIREK